MQDKKNHHYVPQFYLRNFSIDRNQVPIRMFLNDQKKFAVTGIDAIASKKYLYGTDNEIEDNLSQLEGTIAEIFKKWGNILTPPPKNSVEFRDVKIFVLVQIFRTIKAGKEFDEASTEGARAILKMMGNDPEEIDDLYIKHENPTLITLSSLADKFPMMDFLTAKTLVNATATPFITSDSPVIRYNQWMESRNVLLGATGIAVKGLQLFFPISPTVMICLYDHKVYKCGSKSQDVIPITSDNEIRQLNALQYVSSHKSLFFNNGISEDYILKLVDQYKHKKGDGRASTTVFENGHPAFGNNPNFLLNSFVDPHINLQLSFFKILKKTRDIILKNNLPIVRDPAFYAMQYLHASNL
jgi:hypothetical protein